MRSENEAAGKNALEFRTAPSRDVMRGPTRSGAKAWESARTRKKKLKKKHMNCCQSTSACDSAASRSIASGRECAKLDFFSAPCQEFPVAFPRQVLLNSALSHAGHLGNEGEDRVPVVRDDVRRARDGEKVAAHHAECAKHLSASWNAF